MKSILVVASVVTMSSAFAAETVVSFQDAPKFYNQTKTVEGTIATTFCDDQRCFLNFDKDFRKYLSAVIDTKDVPNFTKAADSKTRQAELEKLFAGKKVQVTGAITEYKSKDATKPGRPQITLTATTNIKVITK
jgi:hypothetical protein